MTNNSEETQFAREQSNHLGLDLELEELSLELLSVELLLRRRLDLCDSERDGFLVEVFSTSRCVTLSSVFSSPFF
jgi:hypothetical protein